MPDLKPTALPVLTSLASGDIVTVVDVSDTTDDAAGSDKQMTGANLATSIATLGSLATDAEVASAVSTHAGAADPHGDRAYADSAVSTHSADTTSVHGIADTSALVTTSTVGAAVRARAPQMFKGQSNTDPFTTATKRPTAILSAPTVIYDDAYWPNIMDVTGLIGSPLAKYYLWYSTDHEAGDGGIALATADTLTGTWTSRGEVFKDTVVGNQTETPAVIWNADTSEFWMYYHQDGLGTSQSSALAKSADGVTWTRTGKVIDVPNTVEWPGTGHTGYFRPRKIGSQIAGFHVLGGGSASFYAVSWSVDGVNFLVDPMPIWAHNHYTANVNEAFIPFDVVTVHGQHWCFGLYTRTAGNCIAVAPITADLRNLLGAPRILVETSEVWEGTHIRSFSVLVDDGRTWIVYGVEGAYVGLAEVL